MLEIAPGPLRASEHSPTNRWWNSPLSNIEYRFFRFFIDGSMTALVYTTAMILIGRQAPWVRFVSRPISGEPQRASWAKTARSNHPVTVGPISIQVDALDTHPHDFTKCTVAAVWVADLITAWMSRCTWSLQMLWRMCNWLIYFIYLFFSPF